MAEKVFEYPGKGITVRYDMKRCIHAAECMRGLPGVFDPQRKPWVDAEAAPAEQVAAVVARCPSGALHFTRLDGGPEESAPAQNAITVAADGPLYLRGELQVTDPDGGEVCRDTRMTLCRCGASSNKPFCDGNHAKAGFQDAGGLGKAGKPAEAVEVKPILKITPLANGPLVVQGEAELRGADGQVHGDNKMFLCRCGASANKPFCDGSHKKMGFQA